MKKAHRIGIISTVLASLLFLMSISVYAASVTVTVLDGKISITDSEGKGSASGTQYTTSTASASFFGSKTNTITITNETEKNGVISFSYSVSNSSAFTIGGTSVSTDDKYSGVLSAGGELVISVKCTAGIGSKKATLTLTDIAFQEMAESAEITYQFDGGLGSVTAGGTAISSGDTVNVETTGVTMVATPKSGATFLGWVDEENLIVSTLSTYTQQAVEDMTITALFSDGTIPYFMADEKYIFSNLTDATNAGTTVVLMCNGTLGAGKYTIPAGKILLIPRDDLNTLYTTKPGVTLDKWGTLPSAYRTLTLASGANITVNGAISIGGVQTGAINSNGSPIGKYGHIAMNSGSTITVNSGAKLYAWGYITGSGSITAKSDATVYECFQTRDYRGGQATSGMLNNEQRVFPMSQYYVQNIEVPLTLEAGAVENGYMSVEVTLLGAQSSEVPFIGSDAMFRIESGSITKDYDENTDRLVIDVNGTLNMASLSVSMKITMGAEKTINSEKYTLPINGNITLRVNSGSKVNITKDMALLPGGEIYVYDGAECTLGPDAKVFIYDSAEWGNYCAAGNYKFMACNYAPGRKYTRKESDLKDAVVYVEGVVDASAGFVYTTKSGANVTGSEGGLVKLKLGTAEYTYQATQNDTSISGYPAIPINTAWLKNANGAEFEYTKPADLKGCCSSYIYTNGAWVPQSVNHTEEVTPGTEATCKKDGLTDGIVCSVCDTVIQEQTTIPASGHSYSNCTKVDDNEHSKTCTCGDVVTEAHTWNTGVVTIPATHTATGVMTYTCTVCNHTKTGTIDKTPDHTYESEVTLEPTHIAKGVKTFTCECGDSYTEDIPVNADDHTYKSEVTLEPTHIAKGVKTFTCECGDSYTEDIPANADDHSYGDWTKIDEINHKGICECGDFVEEKHEFVGLYCSLCNCEKIVTKTSYTIEDGKIKINTQLIWNVPEDTQIIIALYNADEKLITASIRAASELEEMAFASLEVAKIKVYAWSGLNLMKPVSIPEEIIVTSGK